MKRKLMLVCAVVLSVAMSYALPQPTAWFKADDGVSVNEDGQVTKWANKGTLGASLDLLPKNGASANITLAECAEFGGSKSVKFSGTVGGYLTADAGSETDLGVSQDSGATFFQVVNIGQKGLVHYAVWGLDFGNNGTDRLGVFYYSGSSGAGGGYCYRADYFNGNANVVDYEYVKGKVIGGGLKSAIAYEGVQTAYSSGSPVRSADYTLDAVPKKGVLAIGYFGVSSFAPFPGDIAELRVYNQALSAAEKAVVEGELASKYSLAFKLDDETEIPAKILSQYGVSTSAFGNIANGARPDALSVSGQSGALSLAFAGAVDPAVGALVYLAGDATGVAWYVGGTSGARAVPLTLTVAASVLSGFSKPALFFRKEGSEAWKRSTVLSGTDGGDVDALIPAGWSNGEYRIGEDTDMLPTAWFKADDGVSVNEDGQVTKWANKGTLGASLDLLPKNGASANITLAECAEFGGSKSVKFSGTVGGYLTADAGSETDLGVSQDSGATFFQVVNIGHKGSAHYAVWGLDFGNNGTDRFGVFYCNNSSGAGGGYCYRADYFNGNANVVDYENVKDKVIGGGLKSAIAYEGVQTAYSSGSPVRSAAYTLDAAPKKGVLAIGYFGVSSFAPFKGDIAELRVYNQALSAAEKAVIEGELASKYSLPFKLDGETEIPAKILTQYGVSSSAFGGLANGARSDVLSVRGRSGALSLAFAGAVDPAVGALVYLAGDATGMAWYVGGTSGARAVPLKLTIAASALSGFSNPALFFRKEGSEAWKRSAVLSGTDGSGIDMLIPAGWSNGEYRIGEDTVLLPSAWFKADAGVTLEGSVVTKWKNFGTLGSVLDLEAASGETGVMVAENDQFGTSLRFDGTHYLMQSSEEKTTLGMSANVGGTCMVVCDFGDAALSGHPGLFCFYSDGDLTDPFGLYFNCNMKYLQMNFFGEAHCLFPFYQKSNLILGKKLVSVTAANDGYSFGRGQCAVVDGLVVSNASDQTQVYGRWTGAVKSGLLCVGRDYADTHAKFSGDIAEFRVYDHPLTSSEQAAVELELAVKYGFDIPTVGSFDAAAILAHSVDGAILGAEAFRGPTNAVPMVTTWSDDSMNFSFKMTPPSPPLTVQDGAGVKSLTYLGSDGEDAAFVPRSSNSRTEDFGRTWYIASACPGYGGVLRFTCDTVNAADWKYKLYRKPNGGENFVRVGVDPVVGDGEVSFTLDSLDAGIYRLTRSPANIGLVIVVQ